MHFAPERAGQNAGYGYVNVDVQMFMLMAPINN